MNGRSNAEWKAKNRAHISEYNKRYNAEQKENIRRNHVKKATARRAWINEIKLASGCVDCGYRKSAVALDFDHLPGQEKSHTIAWMVTHKKEKVLAEIAKCEVVCANCHRIRTAQRRGSLSC